MTITSGGIVRDRRVHATRALEWGDAAATDFWAFFGNLIAIEAGLGDPDDYGWLTTGYSFLAGTGADFISNSPIADAGTIGGLNFDAVNDSLVSPFIFGDYAHARMVQAITGVLPTSLNMEVYARYAASTDENETGIGFIEAGGSAVTVADQMAVISIGATTFELHSGAAEDAGATDDTDPHLFKILCSGTTAEWFIDGTSQGTIALQDNLWPVAWTAGTKNTDGANDPVVQWVHIWYE